MLHFLWVTRPVTRQTLYKFAGPEARVVSRLERASIFAKSPNKLTNNGY
jgi:hypothetical protein